MYQLVDSYMKYHPVRTQRGLEILSGLTPWLIIFFPIIGSFFIPEIVAYAIIAFNIYWLYRSLQTGINSIAGYLNIKATEKVNWIAKIKTDRKIHHIVIIPNVKEPIGILERNVASLAQQSYRTKNIFVVLAMEERAKDFDGDKPDWIMKKFRGVFGGIITTWHPVVAGETIGKHSNNTYAAKIAKKFLVEGKKIDINDITVTTCDVDTIFHKQYFALLTYKFLTVEKPYSQFYQAPLFMFNNLARLPFLVRLPAVVGGIGYLATLQKPSGRFMNFSAYSLSLSLLDRVGYWDVDVIPEDWHINLKSYFALKGETGITPLFLPVYMDAPESTTRWKTYKNTYQAEKRWAWGVVDIPYVVKQFFQHPEIPFWDKFKKLTLTLEWHFTWSTSWFLITLGATIPTIINPVFARTALGYNLSRMSSLILTICLFGVLAITILGILLDPHKKNKILPFFHPFTYLQWIFLPVFGFVFGALPGLESQTRLMLGKYIEYRVTEKV